MPESAVIGLRHPDFGEAEAAIVVRDRSPTCAALPEAGAVMDAVRARLAAFKVPRSEHSIDDLPRNAMGKVLKADLRGAYKNLYYRQKA